MGLDERQSQSYYYRAHSPLYSPSTPNHCHSKQDSQVALPWTQKGVLTYLEALKFRNIRRKVK